MWRLFVKVAVFILLSFLTVVYFLSNDRVTDGSGLSIFKTEKIEKKKSKTFLYLIQTEGCASESLLTQLGVVNSIGECDCAIAILSYKHRCDTNRSDITYILGYNTTWTTGRNRLWKYAVQRSPFHLYYIFMDDDAQFSYNNFAPKEMKVQLPMRRFENFLLEVEPAVGVMYDPNPVIETRQTICKSFIGNETYLPTIHFDALINAIHKDAAGFLLPYVNSHDSTSWWDSQRYMISAVEIMFRGQALMFLPITVLNLSHRSYPRNTEKGWRQDVYSEFLEKVRHTTPPRFRNNTIFDKFGENPLKYTETGSTFCMHTPPHQPIIPYAHFENEMEKSYKVAITE